MLKSKCVEEQGPASAVLRQRQIRGLAEARARGHHEEREVRQQLAHEAVAFGEIHPGDLLRVLVTLAITITAYPSISFSPG